LFFNFFNIVVIIFFLVKRYFRLPLILALSEFVYFPLLFFLSILEYEYTFLPIFRNDYFFFILKLLQIGVIAYLFLSNKKLRDVLNIKKSRIEPRRMEKMRMDNGKFVKIYLVLFAVHIIVISLLFLYETSNSLYGDQDYVLASIFVFGVVFISYFNFYNLVVIIIFLFKRSFRLPMILALSEFAFTSIIFISLLIGYDAGYFIFLDYNYFFYVLRLLQIGVIAYIFFSSKKILNILKYKKIKKLGLRK